jgi:hypothetical protein
MCIFQDSCEQYFLTCILFTLSLVSHLPNIYPTPPVIELVVIVFAVEDVDVVVVTLAVEVEDLGVVVGVVLCVVVGVVLIVVVESVVTFAVVVVNFTVVVVAALLVLVMAAVAAFVVAAMVVVALLVVAIVVVAGRVEDAPVHTLVIVLPCKRIDFCLNLQPQHNLKKIFITLKRRIFEMAMKVNLTLEETFVLLFFLMHYIKSDNSHC